MITGKQKLLYHYSHRHRYTGDNILYEKCIVKKGARQNRHTFSIIKELKSYRDAKALIWDQNNCVNFKLI